MWTPQTVGVAPDGAGSEAGAELLGTPGKVSAWLRRKRGPAGRQLQLEPGSGGAERAGVGLSGGSSRAGRRLELEPGSSGAERVGVGLGRGFEPTRRADAGAP